MLPLSESIAFFPKEAAEAELLRFALRRLELLGETVEEGFYACLSECCYLGCWERCA